MPDMGKTRMSKLNSRKFLIVILVSAIYITIAMYGMIKLPDNLSWWAFYPVLTGSYLALIGAYLASNIVGKWVEGKNGVHKG